MGKDITESKEIKPVDTLELYLTKSEAVVIRLALKEWKTTNDMWDEERCSVERKVATLLANSTRNII